MKVLILAGGFGTRISEETHTIPKPMIEIGEKPILWHIMKGYSHYGYNDFIVLCGYKSYVIKEYFQHYFLHNSSIQFDIASGTSEVIQSKVEPWKVACLDTGLNTMTGGRIKQAQELVGKNRFMLTYGDGVSNIDTDALLKCHEESGKLLTMSVIQPDGRFGVVNINEDNQATSFEEKRKGQHGWINGGFFVCEPEVFDYINEGKNTIFERSPLETLANEGQINCYKHHDFWRCMDTLGDKNSLQSMWDNDEAKWKKWSS